MSFKIKPAHLSDLDAMLSIWGERPGADLVADRNNMTAHRRDFEERIGRQDDTFKFWVATVSNEYVGWSSLQRMRSSPSLKGTMAEWSIYVAASSRGEAVGTRLAASTIEHARQTGLEWILGFLAESNIPCVRLHERYGFCRLGKLPAPKGNARRPELLVFALDVS
jgi:L-amino acid N-acyltransferase YncA